MTRSEDVRAVVTLGVDAIGVILHAESPRLISLEQARRLRADIPALVSMVGVFVNASVEKVNLFAREIGLDLIQLHGDETNDYAKALDQPFIKAIRVKDGPQLEHAVQQFPDARALLLDPYVAGRHGGTGKRLDSRLWPKSSEKKLILAGGLAPDNLASAVARTNPYAVDLNSGVEHRPGEKSDDLIAAALAALK